MKAPLPEGEPARLDALRGFQVLDTAPEEAFNEMVELAAHICGAPIALISLVDEHRQWFKAKVGITESETSRDLAFCAHAILQHELFVVNDATKDRRFAGSPLVTSEPRIRFYAGAPLVTSEGHELGTLCVIDRIPRELTPQQEQALRVLSRHVVTQLELRRSLHERQQVENELRRARDELEMRVQRRTAELAKSNEELWNEVQERHRTERALRSRTEQMVHFQSTLLELVQGSFEDLDFALTRITEADARALDVERVSVWLFNEDRTSIVCENMYHLSTNAHDKGLQINAADVPEYFHALGESRTIAADDALTDPRTREYAEAYLKPNAIRSMMDVPVWLRGKVAGIVCHEHVGSRRHWTMESQEFGASVADMVSLALEVAERRRAEEQIRFLQETTTIVSVARTFAEAMEKVLHKVCDATGWAFGAAWLPRTDGAAIECAHSGFRPSPVLEQFDGRSRTFSFAPGEGLPGRVWSSKRVHWVRDVTADANFPRRDLAQKAGLSTGVGLPVLAGEQVVAVLEFFMTEPRAQDERLIQFMSTVASQLGSVIQRKQAEERVARSREALRALSARLQRTREEERTSLSREIHDHLGQILTGLKMDLSSIERRVARVGDVKLQQSLQEKVISARHLAEETIEAVQRIARELRPGILDRLGLSAAIESEARTFEERTGIRCALSLPAEPCEMDTDRATALFRIAQEVLTNVARHSGATRVDIRLSCEEGDAVLEIRDNGKGIDESDIANPKSLGLLGIHERAAALGGKVVFRGRNGEGTTVKARVPLPAQERVP